MIRPIVYREEMKEQILRREPLDTAAVQETVAGILADVRARGDAALRDYSERFDGVRLSSLRVGEEELAAATAAVSEDLLGILRRSLDNLAAFHERQRREGFSFEQNGVLLGQKVTPVEVAGIYVPGGTAAYPSTVLMNAVPARVAGVGRIVMVTPPGRDGRVRAEVLAAARLAGVDEIYKIGGAQAVAALAYGTESVPRADVVTGPGNIYVATAKRMVFGTCGVDMIAGPSEILVIADQSADPAFVAADLLSQAEHDKLATAVLVTDSPELAERTAAELERQLAELPRREIAAASLARNGKLIVTRDLAQAVRLANELAPEHLEICTEDPLSLLEDVRNAGSVFLGHNTPEATGDYFAGTNHTLPTSGTARFSSPLGVENFLKTTQYICYSPEALARDAADIESFAQVEGLDAHARSVTVRRTK